MNLDKLGTHNFSEFQEILQIMKSSSLIKNSPKPWSDNDKLGDY